MQQRQLRLGDILDDYCPRERRLTNHAVVAMIGPDVKQTRCTTCDAEHEYKHAKVPRQRRKADTPPALYAQVLAGAPKRVAHDAQGEDAEPDAQADGEELAVPDVIAQPDAPAPSPPPVETTFDAQDQEEEPEPEREEGPVHRPLIRASLPRPEGQPPPVRPAPDFTIRQPGGARPSRFRPRHSGGGQQFRGPRSNGNLGGGHPMRGGGPPASRLGRRHGPGRKRSK